MRVVDLLVQLDQVQSLTLDDVLSTIDIDENSGQISLLEFRRW